MKTVQLTIKLDEDLRDSFVSIANSCDSDASKEIRKFMKYFIKKHGQQDLFSSKRKSSS